MKRLLCFLMIHEWQPTGHTRSGRGWYVECQRCNRKAVVDVDSGYMVTNESKVRECAEKFGYEALEA